MFFNDNLTPDPNTTWFANFGKPIITPPKFNMEPENDGFQEELPFLENFFSGSMLIFGGVTLCW